jgi:hypothetical protein
MTSTLAAAFGTDASSTAATELIEELPSGGAPSYTTSLRDPPSISFALDRKRERSTRGESLVGARRAKGWLRLGVGAP